MKKNIITFFCVGVLFGAVTRGSEQDHSLDLENISEASYELTSSTGTYIDFQDAAQTEELLYICEYNQDVRPGYLGTLLYQGACPNYRNSAGLDAFAYAVLHGNIPFIRVLCRSGYVDLSTKYGVDQDSILHLAASCSDKPLVVKELCKAGVQINTINDEGQNAAHYAIQASCFAVAHLLLEKGIDVTQRDKSNKRPYDYIEDLPFSEKPDHRFSQKLYNATCLQENLLRD